MRCCDIIKHLESLSPLSMACDWDNVGLLAGRSDKEVKTVYLALDATEEVIRDAILYQADMLITHHPLIFKAIKNIHSEDYIGKRLIALLQHDISYYAMHTNFDVMGMSDAAADELGLKDCKVLEITYEDEISKEGEGRCGSLQRIMALSELAHYVKNVFQIDSVKVFGNPEMNIEKVAIVPGSGKDYIDLSIQAGVDLLITGDIDHHSGIDANEKGLAIMDAGHYGLEKLFIPYMQEYFRRELPDCQVVCAPIQNPFWVV